MSLSAAASGRPLQPLEAYAALEEYAAGFGRAALTLAMHAAVAERLRPDLLNLIKRNFVPEGRTDLALEADVLFAPFVQPEGGGYYRMEAEIRRQLLALLDGVYRHEAIRRSARVARFLLVYLDRLQHAAAGRDPLARRYVEVERWSALAFVDPALAARRFAECLKGVAENAEVAAHVRFGGVAAAVSIPLAGFQDLLAYAEGLDALSTGDTTGTERLLRPLATREIRVGEVVLRAANLLEQIRGNKIATVYISYAHKDEIWKNKLVVHLNVLVAAGQLEVWDDRRIATGADWLSEISQAIEAASVAVLLVSPDFLASKFVIGEEIPRLLTAQESEGLFILPILIRPCAWRGFEWLAKFQIWPGEGREIAGGNDYQIDKDFASIVEEIGGLIGVPESSLAIDVSRPRSSARVTGNIPTVFISYSHVDEHWKDKLGVQLGVLARESRLEVWDDRRIAAGADWFFEISQALKAASVAVLLVSPDFLASDFVNREEILHLLIRQEREGLLILPILIRPCAWHRFEWLAKFQIRPGEGREIAGGNDYQIDKDFAAIAEEIDALFRASSRRSRTTRARAVSSTIDLSALPPTGPHFFGREDELARLDEAWAAPATNILTLVAWGGAGKSALVNHWLGSMALESYRGAERVYGWSFYSQGTKETVTSGDEFMYAALAWFGDPAPEAGSPWQKGERLAGLIRQQRTLLVLDGLEPLQNPPGVEGGKVKDPAVGELLRHLAAHNLGLCLITTRIEIADIADWRETTAPVIDLGRLSTPAGSALLEAIGVRGEPAERAEAVDGVGGHALTLTLLGTDIRDNLDRDVRRWREAVLVAAAQQGDRRVLQIAQSYETQLAGRPELTILRILGLFDRPAVRELVEVIRRPPVIAGLNDGLVDLPENEWRWALARLRQARLIEDQEGAVIDAHPLVREHFGERLRTERPEAWRAGHGRLYEHLKASAKELPDTLAEMAPLFQAMHQGCQAGRHQEALDEVYWARISRRNDFYATRKLGAFGADLAALAGLFDPPWDRPVAALTEVWQAFILNAAASDLRALGRLREAVAPMRAGLERRVAQEDWRNAAISASNVSELHLALGDVALAVATGEASVDHADRSGDALSRMSSRTTYADALHQAGEAAQAQALFQAAEALQADRQPAYPRLYALQGFRHCDLVLAQGRVAEARERATQTLEWATRGGLGLLDIALDHLSLGRAALALAERDEARAQLDQAVDGLRQAGDISYLPRGLLARAALFRETGDFSGAQRDLDEAMRIARRSEMQLFQCDAHLECARLALAESQLDKAREHLAAASELVKATGYFRRWSEVAELEARLG